MVKKKTTIDTSNGYFSTTLEFVFPVSPNLLMIPKWNFEICKRIVQSNSVNFLKILKMGSFEKSKFENFDNFWKTRFLIKPIELHIIWKPFPIALKWAQYWLPRTKGYGDRVIFVYEGVAKFPSFSNFQNIIFQKLIAQKI